MSSESKSLRKFCLYVALMGFAVGMSPQARADNSPSGQPIIIGVTSSQQAIPGAAIINGAELAVKQINDAGGVNGRPLQLLVEDDHSSSSDAVSSFQRMVKEDHAVAVVGTLNTEVALALEPWAARLHEPYLITGAADNRLSAVVHQNYAKRKYIFHAFLPAASIAQATCDAANVLLVNQLHMKTAVIMSEDAAWTTPLDAGYATCLPHAGLTVEKEIRFSPDTADFTPIYRQIEGIKPDVIIVGWAHVGVQPTVQWANQQVSMPLFGFNSQASSSVFWKATNGATDGVITYTTATPGIAITPKTVPFSNDYSAMFRITPAYSAYSTYDAVYALAAAMTQTKSTDPDALVASLEKTDFTGTQGRIAFQGEDSPFTHALRYGPDYITGIAIQWQNGSQKCIWPAEKANAKMVFPAFVKTANAAN